MAYIGKNTLSTLWVRMKVYVNNRIANLEQGVTMELLWENASPTSSFSAQTISTDLGDEDDYALIELRRTINDVDSYTIAVPVGGTTRACFVDVINAISTDLSGCERKISVSTTEIVFADAQFKAATQTNYYATGNFLIPVKIYKVKGVRN